MYPRASPQSLSISEQVPLCTGPRPSITGGTYQCRLTGLGGTSVAPCSMGIYSSCALFFSFFSFLSPARSWYTSFLSRWLHDSAPKVFFSLERYINAPVDGANIICVFSNVSVCARTIPFHLQRKNCYRLRARHSHPHRLAVHHSSSVYPCPSLLTSYLVPAYATRPAAHPRSFWHVSFLELLIQDIPWAYFCFHREWSRYCSRGGAEGLRVFVTT